MGGGAVNSPLLIKAVPRWPPTGLAQNEQKFSLSLLLTLTDIRRHVTFALLIITKPSMSVAPAGCRKDNLHFKNNPTSTHKRS